MPCIFLSPNDNNTAEMAITKANLAGRESAEAVRVPEGDTGALCTNSKILDLLSLTKALCWAEECPYLQANETIGGIRFFNGQKRR